MIEVKMTSSFFACIVFASVVGSTMTSTIPAEIAEHGDCSNAQNGCVSGLICRNDACTCSDPATTYDYSSKTCKTKSPHVNVDGKDYYSGTTNQLFFEIGNHPRYANCSLWGGVNMTCLGYLTMNDTGGSVSLPLPIVTIEAFHGKFCKCASTLYGTETVVTFEVFESTSTTASIPKTTVGPGGTTISRTTAMLPSEEIAEHGDCSNAQNGCVSGLICRNNACTCSDPATTYYEYSSKTCKKRIHENGNCTNAPKGCSAGCTCKNNICTKNPVEHFKVGPGGTAISRTTAMSPPEGKNYGAICSHTDECKQSLMCNNGRCKCAATRYWDGQLCQKNCPLKENPADELTFLQQHPNGTWLAMPCAPGTKFSPRLCVCVHLYTLEASQNY